MKFVALLRGINVGGYNKVEMPRLKKVFESLGYTDIITYINTGNVIFDSLTSIQNKTGLIEKAITDEFGLNIPVIIRSEAQIKTTHAALPKKWQNDASYKTDVLFLWQEIDTTTIIERFEIKPEIDEIIYTPGALLWRVKRIDYSKSGMSRLASTKQYKYMTVRNCNTLRKLVSKL